MSRAIGRMLEILGRQKAFQKSLLDLSAQKIAAISSGDVDKLQQIIDSEKETLGGISTVEAEQQACVTEIARELDVAEQDVCMSLLIERAAPAEGQALSALQGELTALVQQQIKYNEINMRLLQMNMEYVQFILNSSTGRQPMPTYGGTGSMRQAEPHSSLLDRKV